MEIRLFDMDGLQGHSTTLCPSHSDDRIEVSYGCGNFYGLGDKPLVAAVYFKQFGIRLIGGPSLYNQLKQAEDRFQAAWNRLQQALTPELLVQLLYEHGTKEYRRGQQNKVEMIKDVLEIRDLI